MLNKGKHTKDAYLCVFVHRHVVICQDTEALFLQRNTCMHGATQSGITDTRRQRRICVHPCTFLHSTDVHSGPHFSPAKTHSHKYMCIDTCPQPQSNARCVSSLHCVLGSFELIRGLSCLIPTLEHGGRESNCPHFTGKETEVQTGMGTWPSIGNRRARPLAQSCLLPRPTLTTIMLACLLDATPTMCVDT